MNKDDSQDRQWLHIPARGHLSHRAGETSSFESIPDPEGPVASFQAHAPQKTEQQPMDELPAVEPANEARQAAPALSAEPTQAAEATAKTHHAADIARTHVKHAYTTSPPHHGSGNTVKVPAGYAREHQTDNGGIYDLHQYHTAWQDYYQKYYQRYYTQQLQAQRQQHLHERAQLQAAHQQKQKTAEKPAVPAAPSQTQEIREGVLTTVNDRTKKLRGSTHFMPIMTAAVVGLLFFGVQFNKLISAQVNAYVSPSKTISDNVIVDPNASPAVSREPRLIIPKINVDVPVVYGLKSLDNAATQKVLEKGVAHYPLPGAASKPGQTGNTVILGHSSNDVFAPGDYKFAFVLLERLDRGDLFYIHHEGKRYVYRITEKQVILPTNIDALVEPTDKPIATLVTCTPIGTDDKRLLVSAEQISPDPSTATRADAPADDSEDADLPGNQSSILQELFGF